MGKNVSELKMELKVDTTEFELSLQRVRAALDSIGGEFNMISVLPADADILIIGVKHMLFREDDMKVIENNLSIRLKREVIVVPDYLTPVMALKSANLRMEDDE